MAKNKTVLLDSSVWVAYINPHDSQHGKALKLFEELDIEVFVIPEYVLLETLSIIQMRVGKKYANNFLKFAKSEYAIILESTMYFKQTLDIFPNYDKKLSFVDLALVYLSKYYEVITFDKNLQKAIKDYAKKK